MARKKPDAASKQIIAGDVTRESISGTAILSTVYGAMLQQAFAAIDQLPEDSLMTSAAGLDTRAILREALQSSEVGNALKPIVEARLTGEICDSVAALAADETILPIVSAKLTEAGFKDRHTATVVTAMMRGMETEIADLAKPKPDIQIQ